MKRPCERGSIVVETVLLVPVLLVLLLLTVHAYRITETAARVQRAADVAARVASQSGSDEMLRRGSGAGVRELRTASRVCGDMHVTVSKSDFGGFQAVTATASCIPRLDGLGMLSLVSRVVKRSSTEVIDYYTSR